MAIDPVTLFLLAGASLAVGFLGSVLHRRTGIPDILILMFLGIVLGPMLGLFDKVAFQAATPYFAPLALVMILFDGGLNLSARSVARGFGVSIAHTGLTFLSGMFVFFLFLNQVLHHSLFDSLAFGAALGGTSGVVVLGLVQRVSASEKARTVMALESVITDVLCVVVALTLLGISTGVTPGDPLPALTQIGLQFGIALLTGLAAGLAWMGALHHLHGVKYAFVLTLAVLLMLYAVTEMLGGSGAVAALIFGLVIGNSETFAGLVRIRAEVKFDESLKHFQSEVSFIVRTFFFVYLGVVFSLSALQDSRLLVIGIALFLGILILRALISSATSRANGMERGDGRALTLMLPRGLAAAALASILAAQMPDAALGSMILDLTLLIILFSCITATLSAVGGRKREQDGADRLARTLAFDEEAEQTFLRRQRRRISSEESLSPKQP